MPKSLYLFRHAKSDWSETGQKDLERPLNQRGFWDAPRMGMLMKEMRISPNQLISSHAVRAKTTAQYVAEKLGISGEDIQINEEIYEASPRTLLQVVSNLPEKMNTVVLFGHNPGFTYLAEYLTKQNIGNIPTAAFVGIRFDTKWSEVTEGSGELICFEFPKKHFYPNEDID